jgi:large subunit ribosomal protein L31e
MEKVYVIPLRRAFLASRTHRASKAIKVVREFLIRHLKSEDIRLGKSINEAVWARGIQKVPRKIRVHADKNEEGIFYAELMGIEIKFPVKEEAKTEVKGEKPAAEKKTETKPQPPKPEQKKPQEQKAEPQKKEAVKQEKAAGKK